MKENYNFDRSRLEHSFNVDRLHCEALAAIEGLPAYIHYSVVPLTVAGPRNVSIKDFSDPDWTTWLNTSLLEKSPYIREVLNSLQCRKTNIRLMRLEPGGELKEHTDPQLNLQLQNQIRLHVPIITDESVEFLLNARVVPLKSGELWYMRLSDPHSVRNLGTTERIQLSIDVVVNDWVNDMIIQGDQL